METFNASQEISAPLGKVWNIIADVDNDPKYWSGLNAINNLSKKDNIIEREVTVGLRNTKGRQTVILNPQNSIVIKLTEGPMIGTKVTTLFPMGDNKTKMDVSWDIKKWNVPFIAKNIVQKQILEGTKEALEKIAKAVE